MSYLVHKAGFSTENLSKLDLVLNFVPQLGLSGEEVGDVIKNALRL